MVKQRKKASGIFVVPLAAVFFLLLPALLKAGEVTLAWDPNSESNLAGYKLYYDGDSDSEMYGGTGANEGDSPVVIHLENLADAASPTYTLTGLEDGQYCYFAITAFDTDGLESDFSDEVGTLVGSESTDDTEETDTLVEPESSYSKAVVNSSDTTLGEKSDGSGGKCFITGIADEHAGSSQPAAWAALLLLAALVAVTHDRDMKNTRHLP